jgi:hypothetical protein
MSIMTILPGFDPVLSRFGPILLTYWHCNVRVSWTFYPEIRNNVSHNLNKYNILRINSLCQDYGANDKIVPDIVF